MKKYLVVGAGVSGLSIAERLSNAGENVTVIEKDSAVGGLSRTYEYNGFKFDSGPHWVYLTSDAMRDYIHDLLGDAIYEKTLSPGVFFLGKYYKWPLTIDVIVKLPFKVMVHALVDMVKIASAKRRSVLNYEELMLSKFGKTLYDLDFKPYTSKFTKTEMIDLHTDWSKIGVNRSIDEKPALDSLFSIVLKTLTPKKPMFGYYLHEGIIGLPNVLVNRILKNQGTVLTNTKVEELRYDGKRIQSVKLSNGDEQAYDHVIWTAPANDLARQLLGTQYDLQFITNVFYNVMIKSKIAPEYQWIYYVDEDVLFNRIYNTTKFSPKHAPDGCFGYCVEVTCRAGADIEQNPEAYIGQVIDDLFKTHAVARKEDIIDVRVEVKKNAYPLYTLNYRSELARCLQDLYTACDNLTIAGRSGLFWYNNIDHSIVNALEEAEMLLKDERKPIKVIL